MKQKLFLTVMMLLICASWAMAQPPIAVPDGFAGYAGTTGGGNATPVHVYSASEFESAAGGSNSKVIVVHGVLNVGDFSVGSNSTIVGYDESAGLSGGRISVNGTNYIFQNITFGPGGSDVMEISGGTKVFITKCDFYDCGDELLSIVREADFVTVSWCKFYFSETHDHAFGHLIGNSDSRTSDRGKLNTTMHHNWYANGVDGRMPRVRFGQVHIYNNYYNSTGNGYCIGIGVECHIRLENTHFDNVNNPWADYGGTSNGEIGWSNLLFEGCSQPTFMPNAYSEIFDPPYAYSLDPIGNVESIVRAGAGNVIGDIETYTLTTSVVGQGSVSPSGGDFAEGSVVTITATGDLGWAFDYWSGDASGSANPLSLTMDGNKSVTANFYQVPTYDLTTSVVSGNGSISPSSGTYSEGEVVTITAIPDAGWAFDSWGGDASGSSNPLLLTMDANKYITATFIESPLPPALISLGFNENSGSSVGNTGSVSATFSKTDPPSWSTNVPENGGTSSVDFGTSTGNYYVESASVISELAGLSSFTVTGWVNNRSSSMGSGGNRIVSWIYNGGNGVDIVYKSDGALQVGINEWPDGSIALSSTGKIPTNSSAPASNWRFFAVTYESSTGSLKFYFGDNTTLASLDKTISYNQGAVGSNIGKLAIGHFNVESNRTSRTDRMFRGLIDQVEIYGSVLSLSEIQTVQNIGGVVAVTGVSISPTTASIDVGATTQLTATVEPSDATNKNVSWSSSNTSVATVNSSGLVTGVAEGSATITVTTEDGGFTATCDVTVSEVVVPVTGVSVSPTTASIDVGATTQLTATVEPSNATNKNVSWGSSNTSVATVNSSGLVTGVAEGSAVITVTTEDGGFTASCDVTVSEVVVPVTGVSVSPTTASVNVGATTQLTATVEPSNATNQNVSWSSSNTAVATVNSSGLVTGDAEGSATITVTTEDGGFTATCDVTVSEVVVPVTGVSVSPTTASVNVGGTTQLTATVEPSDATNKNVSWSSSNTAVATVSSSGLVTGVAEGSATITVTTEDGGFSATCDLSVIILPDIQILGSWVEGTTHTAEAGVSRALVLTVHSEDDDSDMNASATYGGQAMTKVIESNYNSEADPYRAHTAIFILDEAGINAASNNSFSVSWAQTPSRGAGYSSVFLGGVNQANLTGASASNGAKTATLSTSALPTNSGDMVILAGTNGKDGSYSVNNGFTKGAEVDVPSADGVSGHKLATGADETPSITNSSTSRQTISAVVINASGGTTVPVTGVTVAPTSASVDVGATTQLTATVEPSNATNKNVSWSSSNTAVATVSSSGLVTGVAEGSAVITVTTEDGGFTATCNVTVTESVLPTPLISLGFNENSGSSVANAGSVSATFSKTDPPSWSTNVPISGGTSSVDFGTSVGNYYVESASVISELAGLSSFTVTGWVNNRSSSMGSGGNRIVSWIYNGGNGVDIVYKSDGALQVGINQWPDGSIALSSTGKIPTNSSAPASNWRFFAVTYESSSSSLKFYFGDNTTAAGLDKTIAYNRGVVGTSIGKLAVGHFNAESNRTSRTDRMFRGLIDQVEIYGSVLSLAEIQTVQNSGGVNVPVTGVSVSPATASVNIGGTTQLTATVEPSNATNKNVSWSSSNTSVATVSSSGLVTGVAEGSATITVTTEDGGFTATCDVTVSDIVLTTIIIQENETGFFSYDGNIDNNNPGFTGDGFVNTDNVTGQGITWQICAAASGTYTLEWRYAHGKTGDRTAQVEVDGSVQVSNVSFQPTGSWTTWTNTSPVDVNLSSGTHQIRLEATNSEGLANIDYISITGNNPQAGECGLPKEQPLAEEQAIVPSEFKLYPAYPNPFNPETKITFDVPEETRINITVFDISGRLIQTLLNENVSEGVHSLVWDASGFSSGIYFIKLSSQKFFAITKCTFMK